VVLLLIGPAMAQQTRKASEPLNGAVVIGRRTYFDFGPPFDYYEIFVVEPKGGSVSVQRLMLTPPGHVCLQPGRLEVANVIIDEPMPDLLEGANPCAIPGKEIQRELKRCKRCMTFSGADVVFQVTCGMQTRRIRMDILDRDLFDKNSRAPQHTSWSMAVLGRLDRALGSTVMEKPAFTLGQPPSTEGPNTNSHLDTVDALREGVFDSLFPTGTAKPSALYTAAMRPPIKPSVELVESPHEMNTAISAPAYPPLARAAHVQGRVALSVTIDATGAVSAVTITSGHPLLKGAVEAEATKWKFPGDATAKSLNFVFEFKTNCPEQK
jgi:TonB family protein